MVTQILHFFMRLSNFSAFFHQSLAVMFLLPTFTPQSEKRLQLAYYTCPMAVGYWLLAFGGQH